MFRRFFSRTGSSSCKKRTRSIYLPQWYVTSSNRCGFFALFNSTDVLTKFLNFGLSSGPEAPRHRFAEVDSSGSCQRRKRHVFDQCLVFRSRNVRGPHFLQRWTKHLDEAHQRGRGKVCQRLCFNVNTHLLISLYSIFLNWYQKKINRWITMKNVI